MMPARSTSTHIMASVCLSSVAWSSIPQRAAEVPIGPANATWWGASTTVTSWLRRRVSPSIAFARCSTREPGSSGPPPRTQPSRTVGAHSGQRPTSQTYAHTSRTLLAIVMRLSVLIVIGGLSSAVVHSGRHRLTARVGGQCVRYLLCGLFPAAQGRPPLSCGGPKPVSVALVTQPVSERGGEGSRIARRDELAGAGAIGGGAERFGQPTDGGGYDGQAVGERFGNGHAVGLRAGRRDEQVGGGVRVAERRAGQDASEPDAVAVAEARDTGPQLFDEVRVAVGRSGQHAMPVQVSEVGERLDEEVLPLVPAEDSDADQVSAYGPGRGSDPVDAGPGDVHPVGRDRVSGQYPLASPFAGNDDAGGRAEYDPFGALRAGIVVRVEGGGQWHMQQHCHSYPAGVREQLRGGR